MDIEAVTIVTTKGENVTVYREEYEKEIARDMAGSHAYLPVEEIVSIVDDIHVRIEEGSYLVFKEFISFSYFENKYPAKEV